MTMNWKHRLPCHSGVHCRFKHQVFENQVKGDDDGIGHASKDAILIRRNFPAKFIFYSHELYNKTRTNRDYIVGRVCKWVIFLWVYARRHSQTQSSWCPTMVARGRRLILLWSDSFCYDSNTCRCQLYVYTIMHCVILKPRGGGRGVGCVSLTTWSLTWETKTVGYPGKYICFGIWRGKAEY